ncbi:MAG: PD-(D/E)XK nuclease family protein [Lutibacter sp.]|uniref:PD-(D/E)XK nuclease family protein n=1 Tax=Lutibacter sp. TaxID=1925666 RepID=UPI00299E9C32|nr:PD-(D/E)XK nuclease family protein [Lutibacter sp.]MDX1830100.1 PD-(D/E)XK nuclease family protein [Lutibacter sp.]
MTLFITKVVEEILQQHKTSSYLQFVMPSQRACVFLKEELLKNISNVTFLPKIISIEEFIQEIADISLIDNTKLLFEFYSVYKEVIPKENLEEFGSFSKWATTVLHDFNEVDSYLINSKQLFTNLSDAKRLNIWFQNKKPSELAVNYLHFFDDLYQIYKKFYQKLLTNKFGYQGLIYREAIHNLEYYIQNKKDTHTVFVGFNALNGAEEKLIQELLHANIASIYWDADTSFFDSTNEAGYFLRKYKKEWKYYSENPFLWINKNSFLNKNIEIIGAPKNISQVKQVGELLDSFSNYSKTAVVLSDENLLNITLNSLPKKVDKINVTMGYPLKDIPLANLFLNVFKLHLNQEKFGKTEQGEFYYKDILNVLSNSFLSKKYGTIITKLKQRINSENAVFLSVLDLNKNFTNNKEENLTEILLIFRKMENVYQLIDSCKTIINKLKHDISGIEKEYLYRFYQIFQQLESLNKQYGFIIDLKTFYQFFMQLLKVEKLSFKGEPLEGLQLMGMLETRTLDFENVIITSVNEGVLPGGKSDFSFIPLDIKTHFGLPTYQEKDAIFSYHFQRLLWRAKNIYLLYNTENDGYGGGEKSRFLTQLEIKYPFIKSSTVNPKVKSINTKLIQIDKTEEIQQKLKEISLKGISPSAIASYIYNPIQFYEQKILGINDTDSVDENIAANTMGTVIHETLKDLYLPYLNTFLSEQHITTMQKKVEVLLQKYFKEYYKKGSIDNGKNKLIYEVSKNQVQLFLKKELALIKEGNALKILEIEKELSSEIQIEGINYPIKIKGIADRIDELNGVIRVVDYKTGKVISSDLKLTDFSIIKDNYKYTKAMQVMLYSFLYQKTFKENTKPIESGIFSFKNLNEGFLRINFAAGRSKDYEVTDEKIEEFMNEIKTILISILNPKNPFIENQNLPF